MRQAARVVALVLVLPARALAGDDQGRVTPRDWDDHSRHGFTWEMGIGPWVTGTSGTTATAWTLGGAIDIGARYVSPVRGGNSLPTIEGLRWCAGLGCGVPLALLFAPPDSLLGNDIGFDVRGVFGSAGRVVIRPMFRYASGIFRTTTLVGTFLPEVGVAWATGGATALAIGWTLEAFDVLVDRRHFALGFDPLRVGILVPIAQAPVAFETGTAITLRWVP
jgi:hypothetical protein